MVVWPFPSVPASNFWVEIIIVVLHVNVTFLSTATYPILPEKGTDLETDASVAKVCLKELVALVENNNINNYS